MTLRLSKSQARVFFGGGKVIAIETRRGIRDAYGQFGLDRDLQPVVEAVDLILPTPPSTNSLFYNRDEGGRGRTKRYEDWIAEAGWRLVQQKPGRIIGPYEVEIAIARASGKKHIDLDNGAKCLLDLLVKHRVTPDDAQCERIVLSWQSDDIGVRVTVKKWRGS